MYNGQKEEAAKAVNEVKQPCQRMLLCAQESDNDAVQNLIRTTLPPPSS